MIYEREIKLIGEENFYKLKNSKVIVFGVGGVGGYVVEFLARAGVGSLSIVDYDVIDETNINRQVVANQENINEFKVLEVEKRLKKIDENLNVKVFNNKLDAKNIDIFNLEKYDYIVDAIDDFEAKSYLIKYCHNKNFPIVSALGAGNKFCIPQYDVSDIYKTSYDAIGKKLRKFCKENCIKKHDVVYSKMENVKVSGCVGSISFHPPACASVIAGFIVNKLIKENKNE